MLDLSFFRFFFLPLFSPFFFFFLGVRDWFCRFEVLCGPRLRSRLCRQGSCLVGCFSLRFFARFIFMWVFLFVCLIVFVCVCFAFFFVVSVAWLLVSCVTDWFCCAFVIFASRLRPKSARQLFVWCFIVLFVCFVCFCLFDLLHILPLFIFSFVLLVFHASLFFFSFVF